MKAFEILVVDDDIQVCRILRDFFLREGYGVTTAENGMIALTCIENTLPDLVISDIQMPIMDGFELFSRIRALYPTIKHIMMTSFEIDQYIEHIRKFNIGNVLAKGSDFNLTEVAGYVRAILSGEIFGLHRYFKGAYSQQMLIQSYAQAKAMYHIITKELSDKKGFFFEIALDEIVSNAIFHGSLNLSNVSRDQWLDDLAVPIENAVKVTWSYDDDKIGVSIEDPNGNLKKQDVLTWLDTYSRATSNGEEHGRGFHLVRQLIDRMIINIAPGKRTECIIIQYKDRQTQRYNKPLLIHEV